MRFIDLFSGIGGFRRGMELAGNECVGFCEFDKYATASYTSMHLITNKQREYLSTLPLKERQKEILKDEYRNGEWYSNDIRTVHFADMPKAECLCFGAPCFVAGTLITTKRGNIPIENVMIGDEVLTHTNEWHKVTDTMVHMADETYQIKVQGSPYIECTGNHPFYVRDRITSWKNRTYKMTYSEPYWKEAKDFTGREMLMFPKNTKSENALNLTDEECYLLGRYVADGYIQHYPRKDRPSDIKRTVFCIGKGKDDEFISHIDNTEITYFVSKERTVSKYTTNDKRIFSLCMKCGRGAENKHIPEEVMNLPKDKLKIFFEGYISGDGCFTDNKFRATSISRTLIYQLGQCVFKVYGCGFSIVYFKRPKTCIIESRTVNQHDSWTIDYNPNPQGIVHWKVIDGSLWMPVKKVEKHEQRIQIPVYNLEVETDHSYTANGVAVHNCQDFSLAGKRQGLEGDRSSLIREVFRILEEAEEADRPEWLIYENVKGMLSSNRGLDYLTILSEMDRLGYDVQWQNIHSEWFVPQHRERIYTVGHLRRKGRRQVLPLEGTGREDSLEKVGSGIIPIGTTRPQMHSIGQIFTEESISPTLTRNDANQNQKLVAQGVVGFYKTSSGTVYQRGSVFGEDAPNMQTLSATDYKEPIRVACACLTSGREKKRQNGRRFKENGEPEFTLTAQDIHGVAVEEKPDKAVIDDTFGYDKNPRIYTEESPTLRSGRQGLKAAMIVDTEGRKKAVEPKNISPTLKAQEHGNVKMCIRSADAKDCQEVCDGIYTKDGHYALWNEKYGCYMSIRKLTPKEYFRLQGWSDDYFEKAAFVNGDTQLYKQAGNGVTVQCVEAVADAINKADAEAENNSESA